MAFFNNSAFTFDVPVFEGAKYDVDCGALATIITESNQDQLEIIKAIHAADITELKVKAKYRGMYEAAGDADDDDTDDEDEELEKTMEAAGENIFEKIKNAIKNLWGKIKAFFKSLYEKFFVFSKNNKNFAESYRKILTDLGSNVPTVKVQGYKYPKADAMIDFIETIAKEAGKLVAYATDTFNSEEMEHLKNTNGMGKQDVNPAGALVMDKRKMLSAAGIQMPTNVTGGSPSDGGSVSDQILKHLRGGEGSPVEVSYSSADLLKHLDVVSRFDPKKYTKVESELTKDFDKVLKAIGKAEKDYSSMSTEKGKGDVKTKLVGMARRYSTYVTGMKSVSLTAVSSSRTAITDYCNQIKTACVKAASLGKENKKKSK